MMKSKLNKSILRNHPHYNDNSQYLDYVPLAEIENSFIYLREEGLKIIEEQCTSPVFLIAFEGANQLQYSLFGNNSIPKQRIKSGIWISNTLRYDEGQDNHFFYLETFAANYEDRIKIHILCSLICSCLIISTSDQKSLEFLRCLEGRIIYNHREKSLIKLNSMRRQEMPHLLIVDKTIKNISPLQMKQDERETIQFFNEHKILEVMDLYPSSSLYLTRTEQINPYNKDYIEKIQQQTIRKCQNSSKANDLVEGPVVAEYLKLLVDSWNKKKMISIQDEKNCIKISEGYNAFRICLEHYHNNLKSSIKNKEGVANIKELLFHQKDNTLEEYKKYSNDANYLLKLNEYITEKQNKIIQENDKHLQAYNLSILRRQSDNLLNKISKQKLSEGDAKKEVENMIAKYNQEAVGDTSQQLLASYLNILNPAVYRTLHEKDIKVYKRQIEALSTERDEFRNRLRILQANNSKSCCAGGNSCNVI